MLYYVSADLQLNLQKENPEFGFGHCPLAHAGVGLLLKQFLAKMPQPTQYRAHHQTAKTDTG